MLVFGAAPVHCATLSPVFAPIALQTGRLCASHDKRVMGVAVRRFSHFSGTSSRRQKDRQVTKCEGSRVRRTLFRRARLSRRTRSPRFSASRVYATYGPMVYPSASRVHRTYAPIESSQTGGPQEVGWQSDGVRHALDLCCTPSAPSAARHGGDFFMRNGKFRLRQRHGALPAERLVHAHGSSSRSRRREFASNY